MISTDGSVRMALSGGAIHYDDSGSGPVLVFIHGVFVNGGLWRRVIPLLEGEFRCIVPTLPLGAHKEAMHADADQSPRGLARLIAEFIDRLGLHDVTLVGNDTGGALCQLMIAEHPERLAGVVLTNCDAFDDFPPRTLAPVYALAHLPGAFWAFAQALRLRAVRRAFWATVAKAPPDPAFLDVCFQRFVVDRGVRADVIATMRAVSARDTNAAAKSFASFARPVLVLWGTGDRFFPVRLGQRVAAAFPNGRLQTIEGSRTFLPEDQPMLLASSLKNFVGAPAKV